jgi:hypothetical protein
MTSQDQISNELYLYFGTSLNSTKYETIGIEKPDREI